MHCIFCKNPTDTSKSVEHIVPEAIGNKNHTLPRGVVCDRCNNYFARKIEGPLLNHVSFRNLRAWYQVPNKKGSMPSLYGFVPELEMEVGFRLDRNGYPELKAEFGRDQVDLDTYLKRNDSGARPRIFAFPRDVDPPQKEMSRFLAKMGLEALARIFSKNASSLNMLVESEHFDSIRYWARNGNNFESWPFHQRLIFPEESLMKHPSSGEWVQAGFGFDIFMTKRQETYFAFCLYGYEFVINLGGPSIKGYEDWLRDFDGISPLIERVGLSLIYKEENGERVCYISRGSTANDGAAFDRAAMGL